MKFETGIIGAACWVYGIFLAKGFWSTLLALLVPLWAWYIVCAHLVKTYG